MDTFNCKIRVLIELQEQQHTCVKNIVHLKAHLFLSLLNSALHLVPYEPFMYIFKNI